MSEPHASQSSNSLSLPAQIEALLYAVGEPLPLSALAEVLRVDVAEVEAALAALAEQCRTRGVRVQRLGNRVQLVTAPEMSEAIQTLLNLEEPNRLSSAALETLAIIAYNQPITKPQLEMIRGVNCDGVIQTLLARNLIQELGRAETVGHPMRYGVSFEFLQYFGLSSVAELPPLNISTCSRTCARRQQALRLRPTARTRRRLHRTTKISAVLGG